MNETDSKIERLQNIDSIKGPNDFTEILVNIRTIATIISSVLIISLVVVCIVIISNSTRSSVFARRKEINIMKYVGATNGFIRIPFFVEGMVIGIFSSACALIFTKYIYDSVHRALTSNFTLQTLLGTGNILPFNDILLYVSLSYLISGVLLGSFGTVSSTKKHLKV